MMKMMTDRQKVAIMQSLVAERNSDCERLKDEILPDLWKLSARIL